MERDLKHLINLRQSLHQNPELSGNEEFTAEVIKRTIIRFQPDDIIDNLGGYGVAFIFKSNQKGPTVLFRADMDALPIQETNNFDYTSRNQGVSHKCGHDGHMAILVGLAEQISKNRPKTGRVILLFQPSEETGDGALAVIHDPNFYRINPDLCFALHNVPGYKEGQIVVKSNTFSAASQGLIVKLTGKSSHAAEPEKGVSPAIAVSHIISTISNLPKNSDLFSEYVLSTIVHACVGEKTFGTSPGNAEVLITLRAFNDSDMDTLINQTQMLIKNICDTEQISYEISYTDVFPTTLNNAALTNLIIEKAQELHFDVVSLQKPFPWAEDFSQFSQQFKSVIFGLGSGENVPKLHNEQYDFPDSIIPNGIDIFYSIYKHHLL